VQAKKRAPDGALDILFKDSLLAGSFGFRHWALGFRLSTLGFKPA